MMRAVGLVSLLLLQTAFCTISAVSPRAFPMLSFCKGPHMSGEERACLQGEHELYLEKTISQAFLLCKDCSSTGGLYVSCGLGTTH